MRPRNRFIVVKSSVLWGFSICDADTTPASEVTTVNENYGIQDHGLRREDTLRRAKDICDMFNREEEMREAVDGKVRQ